LAEALIVPVTVMRAVFALADAELLADEAADDSAADVFDAAVVVTGALVRPDPLPLPELLHAATAAVSVHTAMADRTTAGTSRSTMSLRHVGRSPRTKIRFERA
jgi:hypothetical protein